ncbi:uncharacterized protein LOC101862051 [Aplysia californica]|uniref:Uncharacterized protein LOC101862051 n=1 Tax=Aplysia californica TaxID=6500 RepID=A0ABM0JW73_APLCA|nr:uncharacterized protein LOC101862051 [Aplysia californica]
MELVGKWNHRPIIDAAFHPCVIAENARDEIKTSTDAYVTYVGTTYLGIPIDSTTNAIIIPIAVLIVLVVAVVTVCLVKWQTKKEREDRQLKRQMKKTYGTSGSSDAPPNYNILETTNTTFVSGATTTPRHGNGNKVVPDE